jgi:hypothetical protein
MLKADEATARARIEPITQIAAGDATAAAKTFQDVIEANPRTGGRRSRRACRKSK